MEVVHYNSGKEGDGPHQGKFVLPLKLCSVNEFVWEKCNKKVHFFVGDQIICFGEF